MNFWELIFRQSKANDGEYYGTIPVKTAEMAWSLKTQELQVLAGRPSGLESLYA